MKQQKLAPPTGAVTFLFTDIEGSTRMWEQHPQQMQAALARHDEILQQAIETHQGYVFKTVGDAFCAAFAQAGDALSAAAAIQQALYLEGWGITPIKVRAALHSGMAEERQEDYFGPAVNRVARLLAVGHGGQVLLSQAARQQVQDHLSLEMRLVDLGEHRLKDLVQAEQIYQLEIPGLPSEFPRLHSLSVSAHNLPVQLTSFIGREKEIADLKRLLKEERLVTLTGPGGTGKTRLSLQAAAELLGGFSDGVWLVELAPLAHPELIPGAILSALKLRDEPSQPPLDLLLEVLQARKLLLILDNCEHLIEACAQAAERLLRACPGVHILASSREALNITGERIFPLAALSLPDAKHLGQAGDLMAYESVRLFSERAAAVRPGFGLNAPNTPAVVQICRRLDGIPLALELAAARMKALTVEQIAARLDDRFRLLTGGSRTALPRQQTLRALIDWSYELLSDFEQALLRRLAVFAGGFSLQAAEAVAGYAPLQPDDILDLLSQLADKSLLTPEEQGGETRYRMLETIQQYGNEKLFAFQELVELRQRHLDYFLELAETVEVKSRGAEAKIWLDRFELEIDNLRRCQTWVLENCKIETGLRLAGAMPRFWHVRPRLREGLEWLEKMLALEVAEAPLSPSPSYLAAKGRAYTETAFFLGVCWLRGFPVEVQRMGVLARTGQAIFEALGDQHGKGVALRTIAIAETYQGNLAAAQRQAEESLALLKAAGDLYQTAEVLNNILGIIAVLSGDPATANELNQEALALRLEIGDQDGAAYALLLLGITALYYGSPAEAAAYLEQALSLARQVDNQAMVCTALSKLGAAVLCQGDDQLAEQYLLEGLGLYYTLRERGGSAICLNELGGLAAARKQWQRAARLLGAASVQTVGLLPLLVGPGANERYAAEARANMDEDAFAAAWAAGQAMTMDQAIDDVFGAHVDAKL